MLAPIYKLFNFQNSFQFSSLDDTLIVVIHSIESNGKYIMMMIGIFFLNEKLNENYSFFWQVLRKECTSLLLLRSHQLFDQNQFQQ